MKCMLKFAFLIGSSRLKSRSTVQSTGMRKCLPLQSREGHRVFQSGTTHTSLLCDIASRQLNNGNHHVLSYGCHAGLVREWSGFLVLVRGTDMPIKSQLLWRQYDFWSRNSSSQPREHSEWKFISRKKGKKREEKERGSTLGIKCICLAVGACLVTYTYALFPSVSVFRESQDLFIRGSSLWADLRFSTLANNWHGAWPVWMPNKYSKVQARQCFSSRPSPGSHILPVLCYSKAVPMGGMSKSHCKKGSLAAEVVEAALKIRSSALVHEALCSTVPITSSPRICSGW